MTKRWDVLGFGAVTVDDLFYVNRFPLPDGKLPIQARQRCGGGLTGTALVAASRLGAATAYCGVLGDDELSRFTLAELEREGVDCTPVLRRDGARPMYAVVIVDQTTASRSILFSHAGFVERQPAEIDEELITSTRVLFVDHTAITASLRAVELAHAHSIPVVGDFERIMHPRAPEVIDMVDHLIVGQEMAQQLTAANTPEAMVRALGSPGRVCSVVTGGADGCWYAERGGAVHHIPAFPVEAVDTTGCGDVFHGAYAASLARGESVSRSLLVASAAAALKATRRGGRDGIPDLAGVHAFMVQQPVVGQSHSER